MGILIDLINAITELIMVLLRASFKVAMEIFERWNIK